MATLPEWWPSDKPFILSDCIRGLSQIPDGSIDTIIMDPPYSTGARDGTKKMRGALIRTDARGWFAFDNMTTRGFSYFMREVLLSAFYKLKDGGHLYCFIDWRQSPNLMDCVEASGLVLRNCIVWDKKHFGMGQDYRSQHEFIIFASKGDAREMLTHGQGNVVQFSRQNAQNHPTEKPVELIDMLITSSTPKDGIVLDPFLGSGTTILSCRRTGRVGLGFEINPDYETIIQTRSMANNTSLSNFTDTPQPQANSERSQSPEGDA